MDYRHIPALLLNGDDSSLVELFGRGKSAFGISAENIPYLEEGKLTPAGTELFLYRTKLDKDWIQWLKHINDGLPPPADVGIILKQLGLMDGNGNLTHPAFYKLVEALPLPRQVEALGVSLTESKSKHVEGLSTEAHALKHLTTEQTRGFHDEGGTIQRIILLSWMCDVELLRRLLYRKPFMREDKYFMPGSLFIMGYADEVIEGREAYSPASKAALLDLVSRATPERLAIGQSNYLRETEKAGHTAFGAFNSIGNECELLGYFPAQNLVQVADAMMSGTLSIDGWPDLTLFGPMGVSLVEVKRNDRLMFHQARTIVQLSSMQPRVFANVSIHKVSLGH